MNSAKKVIKQKDIPANAKQEEVVTPEKKKKGLIAACVGGVFILILCVAVLWENLHPKLIFTINDEKVYLGDAMVDIYMSEATGDYMNQLYQQSYGSNYWTLTNDDGTTNAELIKDNCIEAMTQKYMMYNEAVNSGMELTEEQNDECEANATDAYEQLTSEAKNKSGLTKADFVDYYKMKTLADQYKQNWIDSFDIDDDALIKDIKPEDYRQYDIQYYYINYAKEDGTDMDAAEKKAAFDELSAAYSDIKGLADFTTYTSEEGDGAKAPEGTNIKYTTKSFIETDEDVFDSALLESVKSMSNNAITDAVVEDAEGCYIIKMVENNSTERYDTECQNIITGAEQERFAKEIEDLEVNNYFIDINYDEVDKLEFGKITLN